MTPPPGWTNKVRRLSKKARELVESEIDMALIQEDIPLATALQILLEWYDQEHCNERVDHRQARPKRNRNPS